MNFSISVSGLQVAQQGMALVSTNMANVSTAGYHRQELVLEPAETDQAGGVPDAGAKVAQYRRCADTLLDQEILRQQPQLGQTTEELQTLQTLESSFGSLDSNALTTAINTFFGSLGQLAADPQSAPLREQAASAADSLASAFRQLGGTVDGLVQQTAVAANTLVGQVNDLAGRIATLNTEIQDLTLRGANANLLLDQRDQAVTELSQLVNVEVVQRADSGGAVDVMAGGIPLVMMNSAAQLEAGMTTGGKLGLRQVGSYTFDTAVTGGQIGGLVSLHNDLLADAKADLDNLANTIATQVNRIHAQGVGSSGSMDDVTGSYFSHPTAAINTWGQGVQAGTIRVRLTAPDGTTSNYSVAVNPATDTLATVTTALSGLDPTHLSAAVVSGRLHLQGLAGWKFDFLPVSSVATGGGWTGTAPIAAEGVFQGPANDTLTCTVRGSGRVGVDAGLTVEVRNLAGQLVTTMPVGKGYVADTPTDLHDGLTLALGAGDVHDGQTFTIDAVADSDTSGFLAAAGIGTLFEGRGASNLTVRQEILDDPSLLATAAGSDMSDNGAVQRMAALGTKTQASLNGADPTDAFSVLVTKVGQQVSLRQSKQDAQQKVLEMLANQRSNVSGVDINDEAAKLLVFQQMFQGMAKTLSIQQKTMDALFAIIT